MLRLAAACILAVAPAALAAPARFFLAGDGTLALASAHTDETARVRFRRADGSYDAGALARLRRVLRSADGEEGPLSLRLVETLSYLQHATGHAPLVVVSGYRSPGYNAGIRARGAKAAGGSLHTEGLATDVAFPRPELEPLWRRLRALDCCGVGLYRKEGFLHVDVGRPRFWEPATSRVDENLSAGNARLFARTEFDRYARGETMAVTLHAITVPPVQLARTARFVRDGGETVSLALEGAPGDCFPVPATGTTVRVAGAAAGRGHLVLATCEPRVERTPETVESNPVEVW